MISREDAIRLGLEAGFTISTSYGQDVSQPMPISDRATLQRLITLAQNEAYERAADYLESAPVDAAFPLRDAIRAMKETT